MFEIKFNEHDVSDGDDGDDIDDLLFFLSAEFRCGAG